MKNHLLTAMVCAASAAVSLPALAQTSTERDAGGMPGASPPDTMQPDQPSRSPAQSSDSAAPGDQPQASSSEQASGKKKHRRSRSGSSKKPPDNDNNAIPNSPTPPSQQ